MRFFGLEITRAAPLSPILDNRGSWSPWRIHEPFTGAWQRNQEWTVDSVLSHPVVYACITLIANDIGKLRPKLVEQDADGIWAETTSAAFSPVLRKPNRYQNRIQFLEWWIISKLSRGNTYVLKEYDARGVVVRMYILDPARVTPLVSPDGEVFYQLKQDNLGGVTNSDVSVPASQIIHDRMNCLFHPLVGIAPLFASGMAGNVGLKIQESSINFFANGASPSGVLTAPAKIAPETAERIKQHWETEYSGQNAGKVAVLGDGLTYSPMRMTAVDSQLVEHLKWADEAICKTFHVPGFKVGVGQMPTFQNGETLNGIYYSDCLQSLIEQLELCLDEGLGLDTPKESTDGRPARQMGVEMDLDGLLRMDTANQVDTLVKGIRGGLFTPNGARRKIDQAPLTGGDTIYLQHQDYPMEKVFKRKDLDGTTAAPPPPPPPPDDEARAAEFALRVSRRARTFRMRTAA